MNIHIQARMKMISHFDNYLVIPKMNIEVDLQSSHVFIVFKNTQGHEAYNSYRQFRENLPEQTDGTYHQHMTIRLFVFAEYWDNEVAGCIDMFSKDMPSDFLIVIRYFCSFILGLSCNIDSCTPMMMLGQNFICIDFKCDHVYTLTTLINEKDMRFYDDTK